MSNEVAHIENVYASAEQKSAAANSPIVASWRRCITMHHLAPEEARQPERLSESEFLQARERASSLIAEAAEEMDRLFSTVGRAGCCLVLTDRDGVALERRGISSEDKDFYRLGLWTGALWSEASVGTNGIGTAIAEDRPVAVFRDQHFLSANINLSCTTAPIRDHRGRLTAALDISTCREDVNEVALSILSQAVRDSALRIETNLFRSAFSGARFVMVPFANNPAAALIAVDKDDLILGATRAARIALKLDDRTLEAGVAAADALHEQPREASHDDLAEAERAALRRVLTRTGGNVSQAALLLGISRATMHRKMKKLDLH
ncbi:helix-turn-helix domain-containing protein [Oryzifoliimicrobium ureilyticus]|uniref:helix-turn-helix domain-containing protein n=1 Tax=Oryzifoliimicrobium ureilyticus TaxID=3113724 RepID=UPI003075F06E